LYKSLIIGSNSLLKLAHKHCIFCEYDFMCIIKKELKEEISYRLWMMRHQRGGKLLHVPIRKIGIFPLKQLPLLIEQLQGVMAPFELFVKREEQPLQHKYFSAFLIERYRMDFSKA